MEWGRLKPYIPVEWWKALQAIPMEQQEQIQEIRLRRDEPVRLSMPTGEGILTPAGIAERAQGRGLFCSAAALEDCFLRFCEGAIYAHEEELKSGFLSVAGGLRVGVAGTAVLRGGEIGSVRRISSLCVRLPRAHRDCARRLLPLFYEDGRVYSGLLVGEPASGKTSLLRDLARQLATKSRRVTVVDERGELSGVDGLEGCDVLRGYPKVAGLWQAVRCFSPEAVLFDELGDEAELEAMRECARMGVAVISSLHGRSCDELSCRPLVRRWIEENSFDRWVFLAGRERPGEWCACLKPEVKGDEVVWNSAGGVSRRGSGAVLFPAAVSTGGASPADGAPAGGDGGADELFCPAAGGALPGAGVLTDAWRCVAAGVGDGGA